MLTKTMSSCCCCCNADFFFFLFPLSFLTSFMSSTQNLTYLYHDCPNTTTFDCNTTSTPPPPGPGKGGNYIAIIVAISLPIGVAVLLYIIGFIAMRTRNSSDATPVIDEDYITTEDSLQLDLRTIKAATHSFSESNKLGEGDFGEVYKGTIFNGVDIAVKRLEKSSGLSEVEFKNEVTLLAKLQHRNLVRLLGFCLQGEERILVYECLPNESLDVFLFDHAKKGHLNWAIWYKIIEGIARGMLYLHQDSRLAVIHSNLKASNILLDIDMNPKLADFGMARLFGTEQSQENTSIIVGRSGYMSTEYAMHNLFSMKSDIYSFGVLLLEIINGRKNRSLYQTDKDSANDLIKCAWRLWRNGTPLELVDPAIGDNYHRNEVIRCIQIGLLCVQEDHVHRPIFSTIVMMLTCNTNTLPEPQEPCSPFLWRPEREKLDKSKSDQTIQCCVDDDASITNLYPR